MRPFVKRVAQKLLTTLDHSSPHATSTKKPRSAKLIMDCLTRKLEDTLEEIGTFINSDEFEAIMKPYLDGGDLQLLQGKLSNDNSPLTVTMTKWTEFQLTLKPDIDALEPQSWLKVTYNLHQATDYISQQLFKLTVARLLMLRGDMQADTESSKTSLKNFSWYAPGDT
jgi:hypothetical protein